MIPQDLRSSQSLSYLVWPPAQIGYGVRTLDATKGLIDFAGLALAANARGKVTPLDNDENISARARETWVCDSECAAQFLAVIQIIVA